MLATSPLSDAIDARYALHVILAVVKQQPKRDFLDTLAAAYARAGDFSNAIETEQKIIALLPPKDHHQRASMQDRLDAYRQGRGWDGDY